MSPVAAAKPARSAAPLPMFCGCSSTLHLVGAQAGPLLVVAGQPAFEALVAQLGQQLAAAVGGEVVDEHQLLVESTAAMRDTISRSVGSSL